MLKKMNKMLHFLNAFDHIYLFHRLSITDAILSYTEDVLKNLEYDQFTEHIMLDLIPKPSDKLPTNDAKFTLLNLDSSLGFSVRSN